MNVLLAPMPVSRFVKTQWGATHVHVAWGTLRVEFIVWVSLSGELCMARCSNYFVYYIHRQQ